MVNRNEMVKMACAEIGITIEPVIDHTTRFHVREIDPDLIVASRRAAALTNITSGKALMNCITHRHVRDVDRCLLVTTTEVLRNPGITCGWP
jgi:hypothetical protein